jgi:hypothetical protein
MQQRSVPIQVQCVDGRPSRLVRGDTTYRVESVIECWVLQSRWWTRDGPERRVYYRVDTDRGVVDIYRSNAQWTLARHLD